MSGIIVIKLRGVVKVVSGSQRLDVQIEANGFAKATLLPSGKEILVTKNSDGDIVEADQQKG